MHKLIGAYTYIYGKAVKLLHHSVEKSKNSIINKNRRKFLCTVTSTAYAIYQNGI